MEMTGSLDDDKLWPGHEKIAMPIRNPKKRKESVSRMGVVADVNAFASRSVGSKKASPSWYANTAIELAGRLNQAVGKAVEFDITVVSVARAELERGDTMGSILKVKPAVSGIVQLDPDGYATALAMAMSGKPLFMHIRFDAPHYGHGFVRSFWLSTRPEED